MHEEQSIMFFQTLSDLSILPIRLSTPISFIPKGPVLSVFFSIDNRFVSVLRTPNSVEVFNLIDPKHNCLKVFVKSKEQIIPSGLCWLHSKKETKDTMVRSPILVVATTKSLSFYDISLKGVSLIKGVRLSVETFWCNRLNQLALAVEEETGRLYVFTVKEMGVLKLQSLTLPEAPTRNNTFVSTLYRATYLCQYSESRGLLFIFAFSNRDNEFKVYNTVALHHSGPANFSISDNLIFIHFKHIKESCVVDIADVPFDPAGNISNSTVSREAVSILSIVKSNTLPTDSNEISQALHDDPSFQRYEEPSIAYQSYEVQITSSSLGLELESAFQKLFISSLDGRVHGCLDNSGYVKGYAPTISPMVKSQVQIGSYITHVNDHLVVGNTFTSLLTLLRQEKRPIKVRFERGHDQNDPFAFHGESPILGIHDLSKDDNDISIYDEWISYLHNNIIIDKKNGFIFSLRLILYSNSLSICNNIKFLLKRRSQIPIWSGEHWEIKENSFCRYPRYLLLQLLLNSLVIILEENQLSLLFGLINYHYISLVRRASSSIELASYLELSSITGTTRELNGNIVITQEEMLREVLIPLSSSIQAHTYQLIVLTYLQSIMHAQITISASFNQHLRENLLKAPGGKATAALLNITRAGLLVQDMVTAQKQLLQSGGGGCIATELSLQTLRKNEDCRPLLNYYHSKRELDDMLLLMGKNYKSIENDINFWLLNVIKLATLLYDEDCDIAHLYRTYHFIQHYCPDVMKDVKYPNRLGGLLEFSEVDEDNDDSSAIPSKGECMKRLLQTMKETIVKSTFS